MKVVLAFEGRPEERRVLTETLDLCEEVGWQLQILHVETKDDKKTSWLYQSDYPNLSSSLEKISFVDTEGSSLIETTKEYIREHDIQLLILINKGHLKKGIENDGSLISGLLHDLSVSVLVLPENSVKYRLKRILLTTKSTKVHNAIPKAMSTLLRGWPYQLTLLHFSKSGVSYKSDIKSEQYPGWLLEALEEATEGQLIEVLHEMIKAKKLDVLAFELDKGEHPLIDSKTFINFYEECPSPLLFVPIG